MSTREMAINIINGFTEEELVEFVKAYSEKKAQEKAAEQTVAAEKEELEERRRVFEKLDSMVRENSHYVADIGDDDKEILLKHLDEKYGEGL